MPLRHATHLRVIRRARKGRHLAGSGLEDGHRPRGADTLAVQEGHDISHRLLLGQGGENVGGPNGIPSTSRSRSALTPVGRLDTMRARFAAVRRAVSSIRPALMRFYEALDQAQQQRFAQM